MKHNGCNIILLIGVFVFLGTGCLQNTSSSFYKTSKPEQISRLASGFFNPVFSPDGKKILLTGERNSGLFVYDLEKDDLSTITTVKGAGMDAGFSPDSKFVYYVTKTAKRYRGSSSLIIQDVGSTERKVIVSRIKQLKVIPSHAGTVNNSIVFFEDGIIRHYDMSTMRTSPSNSGVVSAFSNYELNLTSYKNGVMSVINPKGSGDYLWVSLSPNKKRVLFTVSGKGTFSCNLNGSGLIDYGKLHAPVWTPSGNVIGMEDFDDGSQYTKSDIVMVSGDGTSRKVLTKKTDSICLFPVVSPDEKTVIFNDEKGAIYKMNIK